MAARVIPIRPTQPEMTTERLIEELRASVALEEAIDLVLEAIEMVPLPKRAKARQKVLRRVSARASREEAEAG